MLTIPLTPSVHNSPNSLPATPPATTLQAKQREANQAGAFFSNFPLHFLALQQALPSSSNDSSSAADDVRTVLAYAVGSDGFAQFDVLYGTSCHEPLR